MGDSIISEEELFKACKFRDHRIVDWYFSTGKIKLNAYFKNGCTILHFAVQNDNSELVEFFLRNGADANIKDLTEEESSLCMAIHLVSPRICQLLLTHGADISSVRKSNSALWIALSHIVKFMHDPNKNDSVFHMDQIINQILDHGIKSSDENLSNYHKLCLAIIDDDIETVSRLADVTVEDINFSNVRAENPLAIAVLLNRQCIAKLLLMRGADPNQGQTPERHSTLITAITQKNLDMLKLLLDFRASVNFVASSDTFYGFDRTPLYLAIYNLAGEDDHDICLEMMELLVDHGAEVDGSSIRRGITGRTALHRICSKGSVAGARFLVSHSVDANSRDAEDNTALHKSFRHPGVVRVLLQNGAQVNVVNFQGQTPLHLACGSGPLESVELLVAFGASLRAVDKNGRSVLHYAARNGDDVIDFVSDLAVNRGIVSINARNEEGETPLHLVTCCSSMVALLQRGGDLNIPSFRGDYPLHYCQQCTVVHYLLRLKVLGYSTKIDCSGIDEAENLQRDHDCELELLRNEVIGWKPKTSLFDLFFMSRGSAVRFAGNENLVKIFTECKQNFGFRYPYFGSLMNSLYWRCLNRKNWVDTAKDQLNKISGVVVPDIYGEVIFKFLSDSQLKIFIGIGEKNQ